MNFTLQLHGERVEYLVPPGLYELMSDIGREVLRDQPTALYKYISEYLDTLVKVRAHARTASVVLGDIIDDNRERIAFVRSLGVSWDEASSSAVRIQRAFRRYRARRVLKEALAVREEEDARKKRTSSEVTPSYEAFIDQISQRKAYEAATKIKATFKGHKARESYKLRKKSSSHTIDDISPKPGAQEKTPSKRDSGLLVYEQSTTKTERSSWSTEFRDKGLPSRERLVYQGSSSRSSPKPEEMMAMPSYYDSRRKVPMISETGQIKDEERDVVTLFSTDSTDTRTTGHSLEMPPLTVQYEAKEIFEVIDKTKVSGSRSTHTLKTVDFNELPPNKEPSAQASSVRSKVTIKDSKISKSSIVSSKKTHYSSKSKVDFAIESESKN